MSGDREQLYSASAEQAVLGGLMLDASAWHRIHLVAEDFGVTAHADIWRAIEALNAQKEPSDVVTVTERMTAEGTLDDASGMAFIGSLASNTPSAANIAAYADIVREHAIRRQMIAAAGRLAERARDRSEALATQVDASQREVLAFSQHTSHALAPVGDSIADFLEDTERRREAAGGIIGIATGHDDIDRKTAGFEGGDLVILAARPGMGKTALGIQWADRMAAGEHGGPVAFFSLEMPSKQLLRRIVSRRCRLDFERLRSGDLDQSEWRRMSDEMKAVRQLPLFIDDTAALPFVELRARARRLHQRHGLRALYVDYLQLLRADGLVGRQDTRESQIREISQGLKALAKELNIPVIALAQVNRQLEQRTDKRPIMSDLRESGAIEQDADIIAFLYQDSEYNPDSPEKGIAEVIFRKQRNGTTGTVRLTFRGDHQAFSNFIREAPPFRYSAGHSHAAAEAG